MAKVLAHFLLCENFVLVRSHDPLTSKTTMRLLQPPGSMPPCHMRIAYPVSAGKGPAGNADTRRLRE